MTQAMRRARPARAGDKQLVVIVGGGFAGLNAAKRLANQRDVHVLLFDQRNHHLFQPLLYQVATAGLNPAEIAVPIRAQFSNASNIEVHLGRIDGVDLDQKLVFGGGYEFDYDYLVLACGARHSYFGHGEWEQFAPGLKTLEQATEIRRRFLSAFESAENELDVAKQNIAMTFVVVGGGPTGVELAGAMADISLTVLQSDFRHIDPSQAKIILLEAGPRILPAFKEELSRRATRDLTELGVDVRVNSTVTGIDADGVTVGTQRIPARTVLWAAGVQAAHLDIRPLVDADRAGRIRVNNELSLPSYPNVFVVGDMASLELSDGTPLPGVAPAAMQAGTYAATMILRDSRHRPRTPFVFRDKGLLATIGKHRAVAQIRNFLVAGYIAWFTWLFVHIYYLVGFKNRFSVMLQWAWSYLLSKRGARLITERDWKLRT